MFTDENHPSSDLFRLVVGLALVIFFACIGCDRREENVQKSIGEPVGIGPTVFTVNHTEATSQLRGYPLKRGRIWLILHCTWSGIPSVEEMRETLAKGGVNGLKLLKLIVKANVIDSNGKKYSPQLIVPEELLTEDYLAMQRLNEKLKRGDIPENWAMAYSVDMESQNLKLYIENAFKEKDQARSTLISLGR